MPPPLALSTRTWLRGLGSTPGVVPLSGSTRLRVTVMDGFADWYENSVFPLAAALLLMAVWGCAPVAMDHVVGRPDSPTGRQPIFRD
jgi:hypothetical protein